MLRQIFRLVFFLAAVTMDLSGQDRSYGRSVVMTDRGIAATSHYLASQAGARILAQGGAAMDAALAPHALLRVTEPLMNRVRRELVLIYLDAQTRTPYRLDTR